MTEAQSAKTSYRAAIVRMGLGTVIPTQARAVAKAAADFCPVLPRSKKRTVFYSIDEAVKRLESLRLKSDYVGVVYEALAPERVPAFTMAL
jgi:hypothetical protein